jgi:hypothetical protein
MREYKNQSVSFSDPLTLTLSRVGEGTYTTPSGGRGDLYNTHRGGEGTFTTPSQGEKESFFIDRVNILLNIF